MDLQCILVAEEREIGTYRRYMDDIMQVVT